MSNTPISDAEVFNIGANSPTYKVVPYQVAQELERKLRDTQAKLDAVNVGYFPTQDQLREWEQRWQQQKHPMALELTEPVPVEPQEVYSPHTEVN